MKKRTVITTEKQEVWVVREATSEADQAIGANETLDNDSSIEVPLPAAESETTDGVEE